MLMNSDIFTGYLDDGNSVLESVSLFASSLPPVAPSFAAGVVVGVSNVA